MINICYKENIKSQQIKRFQNSFETPSRPAVNLWLDMYNTVYYDFIQLNVKFSKVNCHEISACLASGRSHKCRLTAWNVAARCLCFSAVLEWAFQQSCVVWSSCFQAFSHPPRPHCFFSIILHSTDLISVDGCLDWGLIAGLQRFASHGSCILSGGLLDIVEAPGYPRHSPSI